MHTIFCLNCFIVSNRGYTFVTLLKMVPGGMTFKIDDIILQTKIFRETYLSYQLRLNLIQIIKRSKNHFYR